MHLFGLAGRGKCCDVSIILNRKNPSRLTQPKKTIKFKGRLKVTTSTRFDNHTFAWLVVSCMKTIAEV